MPNQLPPNIILCLPASKPAAFAVNSTNFGSPRGTHGRHGMNIAGVLITCVDFGADEYIARVCREFKLRGIKPDAISSHAFITTNGAQYEAVLDEDMAWGFPELLSSPTPDTSRFNWTPINANPSIDPDLYLYHIFIQGKRKPINDNCIGCDGKNTPLTNDGEVGLIQRIAWASRVFNLPLDTDHFQFRQNVDPLAEDECKCADIDSLLCDARDYCERPENMSDTRYRVGELFYVYGEDRYGALTKESFTDFKARILAV